jgi:hypothetical protein
MDEEKAKTFMVEVHYKNIVIPLRYTAYNTFHEEDMYCVYSIDDKVYKHPVSNIWRIIEHR